MKYSMALPAARVEAMKYLIGDLTKRRNTGCPPYFVHPTRPNSLVIFSIFEAASPTNPTLEAE
jgi:hypothetical protein